jgi:hypothetical protein
MIAYALTLMLLAAQAAPAAPSATPPPAAPAAPVTTAPPAPAAAEKPAPPSERLEETLVGLKGRPKAAFTAKLGPAVAVRPALDGEVLIWSVKLQGATVCGANATGALVCGRQGDGECQVVAAFSKADAMTIWRVTGLPTACDRAADLFAAPAVTLPKPKFKPKQ